MHARVRKLVEKGVKCVGVRMAKLCTEGCQHALGMGSKVINGRHLDELGRE